MKRVIPLLLLLCLLLVSCDMLVDLGEHEGVFSVGGPVPDGVVCQHKIFYENASAHSDVYPAEKYHYIQCYYSLRSEVCTLRGDFEPHTEVYSRHSDKTVRLYNGRLYHPVYYACAECGYPTSREYILCNNNAEDCDGSCGALDGLVGGNK